MLRYHNVTNLVLYRKYRPKAFSEVIGQEHVVRTLSNAIAGSLISHAYLFCGPRGSGKTTIARLLAKAVNCQDQKGSEPCNKCSSCLEINEGRAIDLIEIDAASSGGIDEIRELREGIRFAPAKSKYKVFIIDECHQLSKEAANALLKTLEEPPSHAVFILATTEIQKMIPTIISRCQKFDFRKLTIDEMVRRLEFISKAEKAKIEKPALELIALNSAGSLRDAESLLNKVLNFSGLEKEIKKEDIIGILGLVDTQVMVQLADYIAERKMDLALEFLGKTLEKGFDPEVLSKSLIEYFRKILILKVNPDLQNTVIQGFNEEEKKHIEKHLSVFTLAEIHRLMTILISASNQMKYSPIPQLPLELAIVEGLQKEEK
ncbi:MAG: DNA polymerase III subunit gamma/tau [Candidatus Nealsonbacteria bacterium]|nr:DNA polymerase III subunit gamma/tau [Candidatus Nealsonbacteria bacterium]